MAIENLPESFLEMDIQELYAMWLTAKKHSSGSLDDIEALLCQRYAEVPIEQRAYLIERSGTFGVVGEENDPYDPIGDVYKTIRYKE